MNVYSSITFNYLKQKAIKLSLINERLTVIYLHSGILYNDKKSDIKIRIVYILINERTRSDKLHTIGIIHITLCET